MPPEKPRFRTALLKISGEGLCRSGQTGIDGEELDNIASELRDCWKLGIRLAVVIGGGNLFRGDEIIEKTPIQPATGHYIGMLATVINALSLQDTLEKMDVPTRVLSAIPIASVCESFIRRRCIRHLEKDRVVILAAGTGNPFVTTDTAAALRAVELGADVVLKATKVDGVYSDDPVKTPDATLYSKLSYNDVIDGRLGVMDVSAIDLCQKNNVPIIVFNLKKSGNMRAALTGESIGTVVSAP
jgi:uridylate kinase